MAEIRPFKAMRFTEKAGSIESLTCPPYDIISEAQRQTYLQSNPCNIIRLELPKDGVDPYGTAGETLKKWMENGTLAIDDKPAIYVYEIGFSVDGEDKQIMGIIAHVHLEEFEKGIVLPHEETLSKAKTDRFNLMQATGCNFSSIYSLYMDDNRIDPLNGIIAGACGEVLQEMTDEAGLIHKLWAITDGDIISEICGRFTHMKLYIADGHHRYETAINYRNARRTQGAAEGADSDYVMMMMVEMDHPGLVVFPTHRVIHGLEKFDADDLMAACEEYFDIYHGLTLNDVDDALAQAYDKNLHAFAMYAGGDSCTLMTLKDIEVMKKLLPDSSAASQSLDVTVLHSLVLERLMGIDKNNMANQINLRYTRERSDAIDDVRDGSSQCCFLLNPTRVSEIRDVAAAGEKMPQKSTYFYPKLITGLTMNKM